MCDSYAPVRLGGEAAAMVVLCLVLVRGWCWVGGTLKDSMENYLLYGNVTEF